MAQAQSLFWEQSSHHIPFCEGEDVTCLVPHKRVWEAPVPVTAMSHIFPCVQGGAKEVPSLTQETWCPSTRNSTPMPSCEDEDATCVVPHVGRNRRPPSLLVEALSSACPVPIPHVLCREEVQLLVLTLPPLSHDVPAFHAQPQALPRQVPGKVTSLYSCMTSNPKSHLHLIYPFKPSCALCLIHSH